MPEHSPPIPSLDERFERLEELGDGVLAKVYRARERVSGREVALKIFEPRVASAVEEARFLREIRIASALEHPNIVRIIDSGVADGVLYFTMPLVSGETLRDRLARDGPLPLGEARHIADAVCAALSAAHAEGIVHRDVKPANIMLAGADVQIVDFGIARAVAVSSDEERLTHTGVAVGTPAYMSPEQASGSGRLDGRADQYSLACVTYEMLTGELPFNGSTAQAMIARHALERPPSLKVVRPDLPPGVDAAVAKAMAKAPADRYASVDDFTTALRSDAPLQVAPGNRRLLGVLAAIVVSSLAIFGPDLLDPNLDASKVVVFPLVDFGMQPEGSMTGVDAALWLGVALDQAYPLRWYDGWDWLEPSQRNDASLVTMREARAVARGRGAARYLGGVLQHGGESVRVVLRLWDVAGDSLIQQTSEVGPVAEFGSRLVLRALIPLLPSLVDPGRTVELDHLLDREPAAVASWLRGNREYRSSRFAEALVAYQEALAQDSLVGLAALKAAQAASWIERTEIARDLVRVALTREETLPPPEAALAHGIDAYLSGDREGAETSLQTAIDLDANWAEPWMALGEARYHLPSPRETMADAAIALEQARVLDSDLTPPLFHLAEFSLREEDFARVDELMAELTSMSADSTFLLKLELARRCALEGSASVDWDAYAAAAFRAVREASRILGAGLLFPMCSEEAHRAVLRAPRVSTGDAWGAIKALHGQWIGQGRTDEALALIDSVFGSGVLQAGLLYLSDAAMGLPLEGRDERFAEQLYGILDSQYGEDFEFQARPQTLWPLAIWHASRREAEELSRLEAGLESIASSGNPIAIQASQAARGWSLLLQGDADGAIRSFGDLSSAGAPIVLAWEPLLGAGIERLTAARLLMERGAYQEAIEVASTLDHHQPIDYLPYVGESLRIRLRAAEALGSDEQVEEYRARLDRLVAPRRLPPAS